MHVNVFTHEQLPDTMFIGDAVSEQTTRMKRGGGNSERA